MTRGRKKTLTREEFVAAAIELADASGLEALTLKALGARMGIAHTTIYRYFPHKDDLVVAMRETILVGAMVEDSNPTSPRERLFAAARGFRRVMHEHPSLVSVMLVNADPDETTGLITAGIIENLEAMGLYGRELALAYQQIESFVIGSTVFDFSGAPRHLDSRANRLHGLRHPAFDDISRNAASVDVNNESAFEATLALLVNDIASRAITAASTRAARRP